MTHDAIVLGAGPAGSVAALMLARAGWSVAIVEKSVFPRRKVCGEFLSATNAPLFAELGLGNAIAARAGPQIRRVGLYARDAALAAPMPRSGQGWGRALGREVLDSLLLEQAAAAGAIIHQPCTLRPQAREGGVHRCTLTRGGRTETIAAPILIDASGVGQAHQTHRPSDLLGFKAHFRNARLAADLMPVLVFPGGYGGLVTTNDGRVTIGCCIRRDALAAAHVHTSGPAAEAVLAHVIRHCHAVAPVLHAATLDGPWLGAGPIRPARRAPYHEGIFRVGNAAGEAHSLIGEGMSMAMQGAWLLATTLIAGRDAIPLDAIGERYARAWRRRFAPRIAAAALFANLAMRQSTISLLLPVLSRLPCLLTFSAARSGKTRLVVE